MKKFRHLFDLKDKHLHNDLMKECENIILNNR